MSARKVLPGTYQPNWLQSCIMWFRSDLGITLISGLVSQWNDQLNSGGYNVTQATSGNRPTYSASGGVNGIPYLGFAVASTQDLANASFTHAASIPTECFIVATSSLASAQQIIIDFGADTNIVAQLVSSTTLAMYNGSILNGASPALNSIFILDFSQDGVGNGSIAVNGGTAATGSVGSTAQGVTNLSIGSAYTNSQGWTGNIYEIFCFNVQLSTAQRQEVLNYLNYRYILTDPLSLNPFVWFRSDLGITTSSGAVSQWNDQGSGGHNVTQATSGSRPTYNSNGVNGLPYLTFASASPSFLVNTSFTHATTIPAEIFVVATSTTISPANYSFLLDLGNQNNAIFQAPSSADMSFQNGPWIQLTTPLVANTPFIIDASNDGAGNGSIAINGGTAITGSIGTNGQSAFYLTIGSLDNGSITADSWNGNVYEIFCFNYILSAMQRQIVLAYLSKRYGIPA